MQFNGAQFSTRREENRLCIQNKSQNKRDFLNSTYLSTSLRLSPILGTAVALSLPFIAGVGILKAPAAANEICGTPLVANAVINCGPAGNDYNSGIIYPNVDGIVLNIEDGVTVDRLNGNDNHGISVWSDKANPLIVNLAPGVEINSQGELAHGLSVSGTNAGAGDIEINSAANINVIIPFPLDPVNYGVSTDGGIAP